MKHPIILIGGGGHCSSCIDVIESEDKFKIVGIVDVEGKIGTTILGYPIIAKDSDIIKLVLECPNFLITIGHIQTPLRRIELFNIVKSVGGILPSIVSKNSYVSKYAEIGEGVIIMHHVVVNAGAKIGNNCIINTKALIEHDAIVEDNCHISTGAIINGGTIVSQKTFFGSGAIAKQNIVIPPESFIKANSLVK